MDKTLGLALFERGLALARQWDVESAAEAFAQAWLSGLRIRDVRTQLYSYLWQFEADERRVVCCVAPAAVFAEPDDCLALMLASKAALTAREFDDFDEVIPKALAGVRAGRRTGNPRHDEILLLHFLVERRAAAEESMIFRDSDALRAKLEYSMETRHLLKQMADCFDRVNRHEISDSAIKESLQEFWDAYLRPSLNRDWV
jgi:hypothetical protein